MKKFLFVYLIFIILFGCSQKTTKNTTFIQQKINLTASDNFTIDSFYCPAKSKIAVIYIFSRFGGNENWNFLAKKLVQNNISLITIEYVRGLGGSKHYYKDVLSAITFLTKKGYKNIILISPGKALVGVNGLLKHKNNIKKIILLGPNYGDEIQNENIEKLFILAKKDEDYTYSKDVYTKSSSPKKLIEYDFKDPAAFLFNSLYKDEVAKKILNFIKKP